jgi:hypothetical protein
MRTFRQHGEVTRELVGACTPVRFTDSETCPLVGGSPDNDPLESDTEAQVAE